MKSFLHAIFAGALGALAAYFNVLLIPLIVLIAVMLVDYITGMLSGSSKRFVIWHLSPSALCLII